MRIKVQLPSSSSSSPLVGRGARRRRRVHRRHLQRPGGRHRRLDAVRQRAEHRAVGELRGVGRLDGRGAGRQPGARRVERRLAGLRPRQHDGRRRDALPQARRGRDGLRVRGARVTPAAANYQVFENCAGPGGCKQEIARGSFAWRSARADVNRLQVYVQCVEPCQKLSGGEAAAVRLSRADIALTDNAAPTISAGPTSAMFGSGAAGERGAEHRRDLQGRRRRRGGDGHGGRRADGQRDARRPTPAAARPTGGSCRAR